MMLVYDTANKLANELRESEECREYKRLYDSVMADAASAALINEYKKLQIQLQMSAVTHSSMPTEEMQRFSALSTLLFSNPDTQAYLMAEMRLQKMMADLFGILTDAAGMKMELPQ